MGDAMMGSADKVCVVSLLVSGRRVHAGSNGGVGRAPEVDGPTAPPVKKHGCFVGI